MFTNVKEGGTFVKVRNLEESAIRGIGRGIFGGIKHEGFYICKSAGCHQKWKSNEPVYLTFKSGKIFKFTFKKS